MLDCMSGDQTWKRRICLRTQVPMRKYLLINYIDVNEMSNIYNLKKTQTLSGYYT